MIRARVEWRIDPLGLGRIRIRVPGLHPSEVETDTLPWAMYVSPLGGGYDNGSFVIPEVGSWVIVGKEEGTDNYIYFGVIRGTGIEDQRGAFIEDARQIQGAWTSDGTPEVPLESRCADSDPDVNTVFKSIKGATIIVSDSDNNEYLDIIAHSGATIRMINPKKVEQQGRSDAREFSNMDNPKEKSDFNGSAFLYKSITGSIFRIMEAPDGSISADFVAKDTDKKVGLKLEASGLKTTLFTEGTSRSEVVLEPSKVHITNSKSSIKLEGDNADIDVTGNLSLKASNIKLSGIIELAGSSIKVGAPAVDIGGGVVNIGPAVNNGESVSAGSVDSPSPISVGSYTNDVESSFGGDS